MNLSSDLQSSSEVPNIEKMPPLALTPHQHGKANTSLLDPSAPHTKREDPQSVKMEKKGMFPSFPKDYKEDVASVDEHGDEGDSTSAREHDEAPSSTVKVLPAPQKPGVLRVKSFNATTRNGNFRSMSYPGSIVPPLPKKKPMARRCNSCPISKHALQEQHLQLRRSICESSVQKLYDERKHCIMELFEDQWILSDDLDDYE